MPGGGATQSDSTEGWNRDGYSDFWRFEAGGVPRSYGAGAHVGRSSRLLVGTAHTKQGNVTTSGVRALRAGAGGIVPTPGSQIEPGAGTNVTTVLWPGARKFVAQRPDFGWRAAHQE